MCARVQRAHVFACLYVHVCACVGAGGGDPAPATPPAHTELLPQGESHFLPPREGGARALRGPGQPLGVSVSPPQAPPATYLIGAGATDSS